MATRLYLKHRFSDAGSAVFGAGTFSRTLEPVPDNSFQAFSRPSVLGPLGGGHLLLTSDPGALITWFISPPLARDFTFDLPYMVNFWADEDNAGANGGASFFMDKCNVDGSGATGPITAATAKGVELPVAGRAVQNWTTDPAPFKLERGWRLAISCRVVDTGGTMAAGFNFSWSYGGSVAGADGDTWVEFGEDIPFMSDVRPDYSCFPKQKLRS